MFYLYINIFLKLIFWVFSKIYKYIKKKKSHYVRLVNQLIFKGNNNIKSLYSTIYKISIKSKSQLKEYTESLDDHKYELYNPKFIIKNHLL